MKASNSVPLLLILALLLAGCAAEKAQRPTILHDYGSTYSARPTPDHTAAIEHTTPPADYSNAPAAWLPPANLEKNWTAIVIHHSGTTSGNAALFDRYHRQNKGWEGVGYDFVIGNGEGARDGQVEVTFRWRRQMVGAHCKTDETNWANENAVGICLVGNFNAENPSPAQIKSLVRLIRFLQHRYHIPESRIYGHQDVPGARITDCPGKNFPIYWVKKLVRTGQ